MTTARTRSLRSVLVGAVALAFAMSAAPATAPAVAAPSEVITPGGEPIDYVALGDSYSAGPLIPTPRDDPAGCLRSSNNYPAFLAGYFGVRSYVDVTCSGAETADLDQRSQSTIFSGDNPPPQVSALTADTDLVTVGIGGNDRQLFGSLISTCEDVKKSDPKGAPCKARFTKRNGVDTKLRDAAKIEKGVSRVLEAVATRAPAAQVFVIGYPRLLPSTGTCKAVTFAAGDYRWGLRIEKRLNRSLRLAAAASGATYVDLFAASKGHDACAGAKAWINGSTIKPGKAANFHPFLRGMRGAAQEIYRQLTGGGTAPGGTVAQPPVGSITPPPVTAAR